MSKRWVGPILIVGMLVFTLAVYGSLPERLPSHWNMRGEVDGWSSRAQGAFMAPVLAAGFWLLLPLLRRVDPRRSHYERFGETFWVVVNIVVLFLAAVHVLVLGAGLGWRVDMTRAFLVMLGMMLIGLGNYLPRVRSNWWMGIRTPWTLESETVWRQTHRVAGVTFVAGGVLTLLAALLPGAASFVVGMTAMMGGALIPTVYSYIAYRREQGSGT